MVNEDGYRLWLRYNSLDDKSLQEKYISRLGDIIVPRISPTLELAVSELQRGLEGMLGRKPLMKDEVRDGSLLIAKGGDLPELGSFSREEVMTRCGNEGFWIAPVEYNGIRVYLITAGTDIGVLYGVFHFLRLLQTGNFPDVLPVISVPQIAYRLLNHWDNLDGSVERGYAGASIWNWQKLPGYLEPRYTDYARANASLGINGTVLNNVNANALSLSASYLAKARALADLFRPFGIRVFLSVRFSAPIELDGLASSDPCDPRVRAWWEAKTAEIYTYIPDFGGFLVKANSEGQPGPQDYGRTHTDGANMLAETLQPRGGVVIWRAFVYDFNIREDRAKQAFSEFTPLDGQFLPNVLIQVKNGPIDFQPREPFHPLFGAMPKTPLALEFQITKEYLGLATHMVYLGPLFKECLEADTRTRGAGSTVAKVVDGSLHGHELSCIAGVSNIGADRDWCGHHFGQANWYAFGRLAWDHTTGAEEIAVEWLKQTFSHEPAFLKAAIKMMMDSREAAVDCRTPFGLHHIMAEGHHYGPGPWVESSRPDWSSTYYHQADSKGIGFDRSPRGSNAVSQYAPEVAEYYGNTASCPENLLLWFHHLDWGYKMKSGRTLWEDLCLKYQAGVEATEELLRTWEGLEAYVDGERFSQVQHFLKIQVEEALWWKDACLSYFHSFSGMPFPEGCPLPRKSLEEYRSIRHFYVPGILNPFPPGA